MESYIPYWVYGYVSHMDDDMDYKRVS